MGNFAALLLSGLALLSLLIALGLFVHGLRARLEARRCNEIAPVHKRHSQHFTERHRHETHQ